MPSLSDNREKFLFIVIRIGQKGGFSGKYCGYLFEDRWDDWSAYRTQFALRVFDENGEEHDFGAVKIGQKGLKPSDTVAELQRAPAIPDSFSSLGEEFFSLGQDVEYYKTLMQVSLAVRSAILDGLRDVVANEKLWKEIENEQMTNTSLLRSLTVRSVELQFRRILAGGAALTKYGFVFKMPEGSNQFVNSRSSGPETGLAFRVVPNTLPPSNIQVLIGGNGVGKSYTLQFTGVRLKEIESFARFKQ